MPRLASLFQLTVLIRNFPFSTILPFSPPLLFPCCSLSSRSLRDRSSFKRRRRAASDLSLLGLFSSRTFNVGSRVKISSVDAAAVVEEREKVYGGGRGRGGRMQDERPESTLVLSNERRRRRRRRRRFLTYCFGDGERTRPKREETYVRGRGRPTATAATAAAAQRSASRRER